ncbi:hypothetical protein PAXINDRAFT_21813 [Paxillus involutus ATCC 200175]|uniref:Uncharacterized protein n=1 Tax=Paxillus involutus ATCC 200175 TaxID=664439 RepID=A0A0C9SSU5_PAXIN|nr:hypothetical protein PAXINDRAFT_21813 [Paxillus involutus ATCC 200175]
MFTHLPLPQGLRRLRASDPLHLTPLAYSPVLPPARLTPLIHASLALLDPSPDEVSNDALRPPLRLFSGGRFRHLVALEGVFGFEVLPALVEGHCELALDGWRQ